MTSLAFPSMRIIWCRHGRNASCPATSDLRSEERLQVWRYDLGICCLWGDKADGPQALMSLSLHGDACMPAKILVVDDEPDLELLIRQRFRRHIRQQEWHFTFAYNGLEALEILRGDQEFDLVLTDINMPGMDGLTLLGELPALNAV